MKQERTVIQSLAAAILGVLAAWGVRVALGSVLGDRVPFITFFPMIFALAWWGGFRPVLWATILSAILIDFAILEPKGSWYIAIPEYQFGMGIFVAVALATGWLGERYRQAHWAAELAHSKEQSERERLRVTLASIGDAVIVADKDGRVTSLNIVAETLTGWRQDQAQGKLLQQVFRIVNEDTRQAVEDPCAKVLRTGSIVGLANHTLLIARDGTERPVDDSAAPILDENGDVGGVVVVFRDVSEKRRAEKQLLRSQRELSDFFENAALPLHSVGPDGIILRANQAELDMLGYRREEYIGRHIAEFHVDKHVIDEILARLSRGEAVHNCEAKLRCKDGSIKDVLITSSVLWENGKFLHTRSFSRDITDGQLIQDAMTFLANAGSQLATLTDRESALQHAVRLPIPFLADWCVVYVVDEQGEIEYHAHAHCDPQKEQVLGRMLVQYPLDWNSPTASVRALCSGTTHVMEDLPDSLLSCVARTEEHRAMARELNARSIISVPLKLRDRTIGVISFVAADSGRKYSEYHVELAESMAERVSIAVENARLFHAVKEASRQKDEFLAMLAHELRNPLAAIRYAVAIGQMSSDQSPEELFEIMDRQTENLARLIDDLLDVSRISRDKIALRKQYVDVSTIISRAAATARPALAQKQHKLEVVVAEQSMPLLADPTRTEQIVANLLTNAAKYTPAKGRVTVRAYPENSEAVIQVIDTGMGLPPEMLSRVFDLFAQADRTLDRSEGGLGIGLTVARKLAEMHGGSISADSDGLGHGSTFTIRLPMCETAMPADDAQRSEIPLAHQPRLRILVVDDNRDTARSAALLLQSSGHAVQTAYDGGAAIEAARSFRPHAIFLDIGLPVLNGYEVVKQLRAEGFTQETIIAVSGYGQPDDRQRSRDAGFDEHLVKPVDRKGLLSALRGVGRERPLTV